jgi:hypothetical protein
LSSKIVVVWPKKDGKRRDSGHIWVSNGL